MERTSISARGLGLRVAREVLFKDRNKNFILTESGEKQMNPNSQTYLLSAFAKRAHFLKAYAEYCRLHPIVLKLIKAERSESELFDRNGEAF